ncbi:MAG: hypothetical protein CMJ65_15480 [Planctomycetaceae bacterium]|nr:hypothetical protein [Planctomycetaceae bacterium]MDP7276926.1 pentapeptide repeat-containing protein [Planctomycetaceae bacterium]
MADRPRPNRPESSSSWRTPFAWFEYLMQWVVYAAARSATFKVACGLLVVVLSTTLALYVVEWPARQQSREHLQWLVLIDAGSRPGGGEVIQEILEDLNRRGRQSLAGLRLRDKNLSGLQLPNARLAGVDFTGSDLSGADLVRSNLGAAILERADLRSTNLESAQLVNIRAMNANLHGANLTQADGREADFSGADLRESTLDGAHLYMARFRGADLTGLTIGLTSTSPIGDPAGGSRGPDLRLADFSEAQMSGVDLSGASLSGNVFVAAVLTGANLRGAQLQQTDFSRARLQRTDLTRARLVGSNLRAADLREATLVAADFSGADLTDARLDDAVVGRLDWFDWLADLSSPPVRIGDLSRQWRVVEDQVTTGDTRFLLKSQSPSTPTTTGD